MTRVARARLVAVAGVVAMLVLVAPAARAHTQLVSSDPADGSVISTAPTQITLTFDEGLLPGANTVSVNRADGTVALTQPVTPDGPDVTVAWPADLGAGQYQVAYRVVSGDGHPVTGAISFTLAGSASSAPSTVPSAPSSAATPTAQNPDAPTDAGGGVNVAVLAVVVGLAAVAVALIVVTRRRRRP